MGLINKLQKLRRWLYDYCASGTLFLLAKKLLVSVGKRISYRYWIKYEESRSLNPNQLSTIPNNLKKRHFFSVILLDYVGNHVLLDLCVKSILDQVYSHWEIHVISRESVLGEYITDVPVRFHSAESLSNELFKVLEIVRGDFVLILNSQWSMSRLCLLKFAQLLDTESLVDVVYSDHDNIDASGTRFGPEFKPQWCPDSYFSRVFSIFPIVFRTTVLRNVDVFDFEFDPFFEWKLGLRLTEATDRIMRVPAVLFNKRKIGKENSSLNAKETLNAMIAYLEGSLKRRGQEASVRTVESCPGKLLVRYRRTNSDKVSIIIPTRDHHRELDKCLVSIFGKSTYPDFEVVIIDNNSSRPETAEVIDKWKRKIPRNFRVFSYKDAFNYSRLNNYGVKNTSGRYILFLNDDTEIITEDWIEAMVEYVQLPSIGAVGALLLYPDGRVQHAGVILGVGSCTGHVFRSFGEHGRSYCCRLQTVNNYSAVTGACMMFRRELFEQAGGFDESLEISFNDVDLCLKFLELGYRNVYLPHVKLYHHESLSRGKDDTEEKLRRTDREIAYIRSRWKKYIDDDPCYNPNLTRQDSDFSVRVDDLRMELSLLPKRKVKI